MRLDGWNYIQMHPKRLHEKGCWALVEQAPALTVRYSSHASLIFLFVSLALARRSLTSCSGKAGIMGRGDQHWIGCFQGTARAITQAAALAMGSVKESTVPFYTQVPLRKGSAIYHTDGRVTCAVCFVTASTSISCVSSNRLPWLLLSLQAKTVDQRCVQVLLKSRTRIPCKLSKHDHWI